MTESFCSIGTPNPTRLTIDYISHPHRRSIVFIVVEIEWWCVPAQKRPARPFRNHHAITTAAFLRDGSVMAATPAITQTRPIHAVEVRLSPRKSTPMPTPIGTRR